MALRIIVCAKTIVQIKNVESGEKTLTSIRKGQVGYLNSADENAPRNDAHFPRTDTRTPARAEAACAA